MASLTVWLDDYTEVTLHDDGLTTVDLAGMRVARHDLLGTVTFLADGTITLPHHVEDADVTAPLPRHVVRAADNAARRQALRAKRVARQIARAHAARRRETPAEGGGTWIELPRSR